jgi:hypothetical protein
MIECSIRLTEDQEKALAVIKQGKRHTLLYGGSRCFVAGQKVITQEGTERIEDITPGRAVLSMDEASDTLEYKRVSGVHKYADNKKPMVRLRLKNGQEIIGTEDHEIFYEGGWHPLKYVLKCVHGRVEANTGV